MSGAKTYPKISAGAMASLDPTPGELAAARRKNELAKTRQHRNDFSPIQRRHPAAPVAEMTATGTKNTSATMMAHLTISAGAMARLEPTPGEIKAAKLKNESAMNDARGESSMPDATAQPSQRTKKFYSKPPASTEEPAYLRDDPGLACLMSQLGRVDAQLRCLDSFRAKVAEAEEQCKRDLAAKATKTSASKSTVSTSSPSNDDAVDNDDGVQSNHSVRSKSLAVMTTDDAASGEWVKHW
mmetsp:Transcript_7751/g.19247  ORF Transcript_7751/g.19247 Transcript_7751/m.19247 type:complete len:241 (+) Transcript_7751:1703-2425(+)|eukprot:CAMPEP_0181108450 /NCGR_PEP_ID=MMETSP1071-20121207/17639_1 /TAXON_ID=35127 /ORGANISM="Thalassiosira sp., Strain NH16" /LENGTH=240 /DNA_ID=CAMNT_0023192059 /DNA_START=978 /DNA_END=1700 /DNA_ORIENTATION=+